MNSPINYYGSKASLSKTILSYFPESYDVYIEAFGGGGSILFAKEEKPHEIYNDLEQNVYSLFKVLSNPEQFEQFKAKCDLAYFSQQLWREFKEELKGELDIVDRAFKFFYVCRTSFGSQGGFRPVFQVRRNMSKHISDLFSAVDKLEEVHQRLSFVSIYNMDALELIPKFDKENVFFYLDPPYVWDTRSSVRYKQDFSNVQQEQFTELMLNLKGKALISGYSNTIYEKLEKAGWERIDFEVSTRSSDYQARMKTESLWKNY